MVAMPGQATQDVHGCKTSLILQVELPALGCTTLLCYAVKPARKHNIVESMQEIVHTILDEWRDDLVSVDNEGTAYKLDVLRRRATENIKEWQTKLKWAEEMKIKYDRSASTMNKMRDSYYKELQHLHEQVYQKKQAEKRGTVFTPTTVFHFDPSEYAMDDEVTRLVNDKVCIVQREFNAKLDKVEDEYHDKINVLNDKIASTKMMLKRKEMLLKKLKQVHGIDDSHAQIADEHANGNDEEGLSDGEDGERPGKLPEELRRFRSFLEDKFGSLKEAKTQLGLRRKLDEMINLPRFELLSLDIGFAGDTTQLFRQLCGGETSAISISCLLDKAFGRSKAFSRRASFSGVPSESGAGAGIKRRNSFLGVVVDECAKLKHTKVSIPIPQDSDMMSEAGGPSCMPSSSDESSGCSRAPSQMSRMSRRSGRSEVSMRSTRSGKRQGTKAISKKPQEAPRSCETVERGTDAQPYHEAFGRLRYSTRAVQTKIDARILDKAVEFFDVAAEDNWNRLAGIFQDEDPSEECGAKSAWAGAGEGTDGAAAGGAVEPEGEPGALQPTSALASSSKKPLLSGKWLKILGDEPLLPQDGADCFFSASAGMLCSPRQLQLRHGLQSDSDRPAGRPRFNLARPDRRTADVGVQCMMHQPYLRPRPSELSFTTDEAAPEEVQLQELSEMMTKIRLHVPEMRARTKKLASEGNEHSDRAQRLLDQIDSLGASVNNVDTANANDELKPPPGPPKRASVQDLVRRHSTYQAEEGEPAARHTFSGMMAHRQTRFVPSLAGAKPLHARIVHTGSQSPPTGLRSPGSEADDVEPDDGKFRGMAAHNAMPMVGVDSTRIIRQRARRRSQDCGATENDDPKDAQEHSPGTPDQPLNPGWSGLVPEPSFQPRNVPAEKECGAPVERAGHRGIFPTKSLVKPSKQVQAKGYHGTAPDAGEQRDSMAERGSFVEFMPFDDVFPAHGGDQSPRRHVDQSPRAIKHRLSGLSKPPSVASSAAAPPLRRQSSSACHEEFSDDTGSCPGDDVEYDEQQMFAEGGRARLPTISTAAEKDACHVATASTASTGASDAHLPEAPHESMSSRLSFSSAAGEQRRKVASPQQRQLAGAGGMAQDRSSATPSSVMTLPEEAGCALRVSTNLNKPGAPGTGFALPVDLRKVPASARGKGPGLKIVPSYADAKGSNVFSVSSDEPRNTVGSIASSTISHQDQRATFGSVGPGLKIVPSYADAKGSNVFSVSSDEPRNTVGSIASSTISHQDQRATFGSVGSVSNSKQERPSGGGPSPRFSNRFSWRGR